RVGKHVELTVRDADGEQAARRMAEALLANPVIEEFSVPPLPAGAGAFRSPASSPTGRRRRGPAGGVRGTPKGCPGRTRQISKGVPRWVGCGGRGRRRGGGPPRPAPGRARAS